MGGGRARKNPQGSEGGGGNLRRGIPRAVDNLQLMSQDRKSFCPKRQRFCFGNQNDA